MVRFGINAFADNQNQVVFAVEGINPGEMPGNVTTIVMRIHQLIFIRIKQEAANMAAFIFFQPLRKRTVFSRLASTRLICQ